MSKLSGDGQVAAGVFAFTGTQVNWVIIADGTQLTLVDAGWPGDVQEVERSIRSLGRHPRDVRAVLLTHAHVDHAGALNHLHDDYGVPMWMDAVEVPNANGERVETGTPIDVARRLYRPQVVRWSWQMIRADGLRPIVSPAAQAFPHDGPLDLPGRPVPVRTPGHTSGHVSYFLPSAGLVISGDALVTAHPTLNGVGPRLLPAEYSHDQAAATESLQTLRELDVDVFVPGHGPAWYGPISAAVDQAVDRVADGRVRRRSRSPHSCAG